MKRLERAVWLVGCGTAAILAACLGLLFTTGQGMLFSPGPLSAEHISVGGITNITSHADFETRCEQCHAPFRGPDAALCMRCHRDVSGQVSGNLGIHGGLVNSENCALCHPDHQGRGAGLTRVPVSQVAHNQFGFSLVYHQRNYDGASLSCRSCHPADQTPRTDKIAVVQACVDCHARRDAAFVIDHRKQAGDACVACHDGTDRLVGFDHEHVYPLRLKHESVACTRCHANNNYKGTPRDCIRCHPDSQAHLGQFGTDCSACHTTAGWRPARLIKHAFPLAHGTKGKDSTCQTCHLQNYGTYSCYVCHDHNEAKIKQEHIGWNKWDTDCVRCHQTGKRIE